MDATARRSPALTQGAALMLFAAGLFAAYAPVMRALAAHWYEDANYSHGFLIVPLSLYFSWKRRDAWCAAPHSPSWLGVVVVAASLGLLIAGVAAAELFVARLSLIGVLAGVLLFVFGARPLRAVAFPLAFLLLMIPPPEILFNQVALPLQLFASRTGEVLLRGAGVPVLRDGNVLELVSMRLEVAEACSGIRSIVSLLTFALVLGELGDASTRRRLLLACATIPIAVCANAARVAATGLAADAWGVAAAQGFLHTTSGMAVFAIAVAALLLIERIVTRVRTPLRAGAVA